MSRAFEVTREIDLPAAPDDVWTAITAAPAAWMFPTADAMDVLRSAMGVSTDAGVGDAVQASPGDAGPLDGVIDYSTPQFLGVRTSDGLYRVFGRNHYGGVVGMSAHLFVDGVDAGGREAQLKARLEAVYA